MKRSFLLAPVIVLVSLLTAVSPAWGSTERGPTHQGAGMPVPPPHKTYRGVDFVSVTSGWAVGDAGTIIRTVDGGLSWTVQISGTAQNLNAVSFADATHGWAVGDGGTIVATSNGGTTWTTQTSNVGENLVAVSFADASHGCAVGSNLAVVWTADGGATWTPSVAVPPQQFDSRLTGVYMEDATHVVVSGYYLDFMDAWLWGFVESTADGGASWQNAILQPHWQAFDHNFSDANHGWTLGQFTYPYSWEPLLFVTTDGCATWGMVRPGKALLNATFFDDVAFADASHGWVTAAGSIAATTDGGATWAKQDSGVTASLQDIVALDASHAVAVGDGGTIITTSDGGATWVQRGGFPLPETKAAGFVPEAWVNHTVKVTLTATAYPPATSVSSISYSWDEGASTVAPGGSAVVSFAVDAVSHAQDGQHAIHFAATDDIGQAEDPKELYFIVDTRKPSTKAPYAASAKRSAQAKLKFQINDTQPCQGRAKVSITIKNSLGKVVKVIRPTRTYVVNRLNYVTFTVPRTWRTGTYKFFVYATDTAGNKQANVASNKLVVK